MPDVLAPCLRLLACAALLLWPARAQAQGRIDVVNNQGVVTPLSDVIVLSETLDEVRFRRGPSGRTEDRKTLLVADITYGPGSPSYERAQQALAEGDLTNATNLFAAAIHDTEPPWVAAVARLRLAEAQALRGDAHLTEALAAVADFLAQHPEHRLLPRALLLQARLAAKSGERGTADAAVARVLEFAAAGRLAPHWAPRAQLEHGQNLLDGGDAKAAGAAFERARLGAEQALANPGERLDLKPQLETIALQARSGSGAALLAAGDLAGARTYYQRLAQDGGNDPAIRAASLNGLAQADFHDKGKLKQAQLGFARVAVTGAGVPEEHAKALYYLGRCAETLGQEGREANARAKALEYFQETQARYPGTRWGRMARESLP